jgi:hypothetical protein
VNKYFSINNAKTNKLNSQILQWGSQIFVDKFLLPSTLIAKNQINFRYYNSTYSVLKPIVRDILIRHILTMSTLKKMSPPFDFGHRIYSYSFFVINSSIPSVTMNWNALYKTSVKKVSFLQNFKIYNEILWENVGSYFKLKWRSHSQGYDLCVVARRISSLVCL